MPIKSRAFLVFFLLLLFMMVACGGGGGANSNITDVDRLSGENNLNTKDIDGSDIQDDFTENISVPADPNGVSLKAGEIITVAGGNIGDGELATNAVLNRPEDIAIDSSGNIYIASYWDKRIRYVDINTGIITTIAGNGELGFRGDGGPARQAMLEGPLSIAVDELGSLYIASQDHRIRKVDLKTNIISTVAGTGENGFSGDGGPARLAKLNYPDSLALDSIGNLYIEDRGNCRIRKIDRTTEIISTIAGTGKCESSGDGDLASLAGIIPYAGIALDSSDNLYIAEPGRIRKVDAVSGIISTIAGTGLHGYDGDGGPAITAMIMPNDIEVDGSGNIYIAEGTEESFLYKGNNRIRKIEAKTGIISTIAGIGEAGFSGDGDNAIFARLNEPYGLVVDNSDNIYFSDSHNHRIRRIDATSNIITTVAGIGQNFRFSGDGGAATNASLGFPHGIAVAKDGSYYIADTQNHRIRKVDAESGIIMTIAGTGQRGFFGDGGPAIAAVLNSPETVILDSNGDLYVADRDNHRIRKIDTTTGLISTVAGTGIAGYSGDNGPSNYSQLNSPHGLALDKMGNLYIADHDNHVIRKVDLNTGIIITVAGDGSNGFGGDGGAAVSAQLSFPKGIVVDTDGNLFIADTGNHLIRRVDAITGTISTTVLGLDFPIALAVDTENNLYVGEKYRIRRVSGTAGTVTIIGGGEDFYGDGQIVTIAGTGEEAFYGDGGPAVKAAIDEPHAIAFDSVGNMYIVDRQNNRIRRIERITSQ